MSDLRDVLREQETHPWRSYRPTQEARRKQAAIRQFASGADRDTADGKLRYTGFLCPLVLKRYAEYMRQHQVRKDGTRRSADNWKKGIPSEAYADSGLRHFMDVWLHLEGRGEEATEDYEDSLCALLFNGMGLLRNHLLEEEDNG